MCIRDRNYPFHHAGFGFFASLIGLVTGMLIGIPFVLVRRGWFTQFWMYLTNRDLLRDQQHSPSQVVRLNELARRRRQRTTGTLVFWSLAALVAGVAAWLAQEPHHRDAATFSGIAALMLAILFGGVLLTRLFFRKISRETAL